MAARGPNSRMGSRTGNRAANKNGQSGGQQSGQGSQQGNGQQGGQQGNAQRGANATGVGNCAAAAIVLTAASMVATASDVIRPTEFTIFRIPQPVDPKTRVMRTTRDARSVRAAAAL